MSQATVEQPFRSFLLMPFRGEGASAANCPMIGALRELLDCGAPLGDLFLELCGGDAPLYDFNALRTERALAEHSHRHRRRTVRTFDGEGALHSGALLSLSLSLSRERERRLFQDDNSLSLSG